MPLHSERISICTIQIGVVAFNYIKKEGTRIKKKNGEWASKHIDEQAEVLERLEFRGYRAVFAVGFDEAKEVIDEYLKA